MRLACERDSKMAIEKGLRLSRLVDEARDDDFEVIIKRVDEESKMGLGLGFVFGFWGL